MKNTFVYVVLILGILLCLSGCSNSSEPDEKQLQYDLGEYGVKELSIEHYTINDISIDRLKVESNTAHYWCTIEIDNEMYNAVASVEIEYDYYKKGGWIINDVYNFDITEYSPKTGYSEQQAIDNLYSQYGNLNVVDHQTDLDKGYDIISLRYTKHTAMYDQVGTVVCKYSFDKQCGWINESTKLEDTSISVHPVGAWYESELGGNWNRTIVFEDYTNDTISIADYFIDTLDDEYYITYYTCTVNVDSNDNVTFGNFQLTEDGVISDNDRTMKKSSALEQLDNYVYLGAFYKSSYKGDTSKAVVIPDLLGKTYDEAEAIIISLGLRCKKINTGAVVRNISLLGATSLEGYKSELAGGTKIEKGSIINLYCW